MSTSHEQTTTGTIDLTERNFDEALAAAQGLALVDFWAEWCGPCRMVAPVLEELAEASEGQVTLMKVNVDESPALAARYGIRSIPTILFVKEGTVVEVYVPAETSTKRPRSIGDSPFAGIWKDREDMADSVEYINRLRSELHG